MTQLVRNVAVLAILIGQLAASTQALALADCGDPASAHASAGAAHPPDAHHGPAGHGQEAEAAEEQDASEDAVRCQCVGGFHCGQLAALVTDPVAAADAPPDGSPYPAALLPRPMLAHRRELDRPPA